MKIVSPAFVSCQQGSREIAIELTIASASNPADGLMPAAMPSMSQSIAMEIPPCDRVLDSMFSECGEKTAFAPTSQTFPAAPPLARPGPSPKSGPGAPSAGAAWKPAPGTRLLVQRTSTPWWRVKPRSGTGSSGFVREDRLVVE